MRYRHRRQTCTSLYHHRSRFHSPPSKIPESTASLSSKISGRQRENMLRRESSSRMWISVRGCLSQVGPCFTKKLTRHREQGAYLEFWETRPGPPRLHILINGRTGEIVEQQLVTEGDEC